MTPPLHRVVLTGMGAVSAFGRGRGPLTEACFAGRNGIGPISRFDPQGLPVHVAAELPDDDLPAPANLRGLPARMAWTAAREAWELAKLDGLEVSIGFSAAVGWTPPPVEWLTTAGFPPPTDPSWVDGESDWLNPGTAEPALAVELGCSGPVLADHAACSAALHSIAHAARWVQQGRIPVALAGAADSRCHPLGLIGYARLGALAPADAAGATTVSRPFDRDRSGFVVGEGSGFFVLETLEHARQRGVDILAEIIGWSLSNDAHSPADPDPEFRSGARCVRQALERAGCQPDEIDAINAHGTSTDQNDRMESRLYADVFGRAGNGPAIGSLKSMIGHCSMASGAVESVVAIECLRRQCLPPNRNLENPCVEAVGLNLLPGQAVHRPVRNLMKCAFGLGGQNAALVFRRWDG